MITVTSVRGDRLRVQVRGHEVFTDQPLGDGGEDTAPTPTELFVASLGACVCFYAERFLRRHGLPVDGLGVACDYSWAENPHRVGAIRLTVEAPGLTEERRQAFIRVVEHCTVHSSLLAPPEIALTVSTPARSAA